MDKQQAIDLLDNLIGMIEDNQDNDYDAAFRMAIDALKTQLYREDATSDLISRQAALDAMGKAKWAKERLMELPAVQPDHTADISKKAEGDCISRQAAIDALDIAIERYGEIAEEYRKKADIERNDYMDMRDNAYEAQQLAQWLNELKYLREKIEQITIKTESQWIPCSERLPERADNVIICYKAGDYTLVSTGRYLYKFKMWYVDVVGDLRDGVTAWMPLPEPYRGGEK